MFFFYYVLNSIFVATKFWFACCMLLLVFLFCCSPVARGMPDHLQALPSSPHSHSLLNPPVSPADSLYLSYPWDPTPTPNYLEILPPLELCGSHTQGTNMHTNSPLAVWSTNNAASTFPSDHYHILEPSSPIYQTPPIGGYSGLDALMHAYWSPELPGNGRVGCGNDTNHQGEDSYSGETNDKRACRVPSSSGEDQLLRDRNNGACSGQATQGETTTQDIAMYNDVSDTAHGKGVLRQKNNAKQSLEGKSRANRLHMRGLGCGNFVNPMIHVECMDRSSPDEGIWSPSMSRNEKKFNFSGDLLADCNSGLLPSVRLMKHYETTQESCTLYDETYIIKAIYYHKQYTLGLNR